MGRGFRFHPPPVAAEPELCWVLKRALGPADARQGAATLDGERCAAIAERLDLAARVGARTPLAVLEEALGAEAARRIRSEAMAAAASGMVVERVCREIAGLASELCTPVVFLKGAALLLGSRTQPGSRCMGDIDALVSGDAAETLQGALIARGCSALDAPASEHQLQLLSHPLGIGIEVHTCLPGVRLDGRSSATAGALAAAGLVDRLAEMEGSAGLLNDAVMLAHLVVHGLGQHGLAPQSYPLVRLIGDVQDLCGSRARWDLLLPQAMAWIGADVPAAEAFAVRDLALGLADGEDPRVVLEGEGGASLLLRHAVAGVLDTEYWKAIRLQGLARPLAATAGRYHWARRVLHAVWLSRVQVEILYGRPRSALGYWGWRLWRPFDLVVRAVRYGRAWLEHRRRVGSP